MRRIILSLTFLIFFSGRLAAQVTAPTVHAGEFKIGGLLHITGQYAREGLAFKEGMQLAAKEINALPGTGLPQIKLIFEDTQFDRKMAVTAAKKLINEDKVDAAVIGTITEAPAVTPDFESNKIPLTVLWDSDPTLEAMGDYIFGIGTWGPSTGETAADFAINQLKLRRAVIISTINPWSESVSQYFTAKYTSLGGQVIDNLQSSPDNLDFRTLLAKIRAEKPDVIYALVSENYHSFFKQLAQANLNIPVITADILSGEVLNQLGGDIEGVYETLTADPTTPRAKLMITQYRKRFGKHPELPMFSAWGYDAVQIYYQALKLKLTEQATTLNAAMYLIKNFPGASGTITITPAGSSPTPVGLYQIKQGQLSKLR